MGFTRFETMKTMHIAIEGLVDTTTISCPHCANSRAVPNVKLREFGRPLKVKCTCGQVFALSLNHRKFRRKAVHLNGHLLSQSSHSTLAQVTIVNISLNGVGFKAPGMTLDIGQAFTLTFYLDDEAKTPVTEDIVIRNLRSEVIGAEFVNQDTYNFDLDFYMMDPRAR
jgi:hypothetical protein